MKLKTIKTHQQELELLDELGFSTNPLNKKVDSIQEVWQYFLEIQKQKDSLNYQIDGMVVKLNDLELTDKAGVVGKTKRAWSAIKFPSQEAITKIIGITWQVGRTGKLTPVAELKPTLLQGTVVKRATLHNYKEVLEAGLTIEDTLVIQKAGDIIPEVVKILTNLRPENSIKFSLPEVCPSCGTRLVLSKTKVDAICTNTGNCKSQIRQRLSYYCQRNIANISGLSKQIINKFITEFAIKDIADIYDLPYKQIFELEGFSDKSVENLKKSIDKARQIPDYKFLAGLGIEGLGLETAKLICKLI
jgi:DNA ligase (NAD+)